MKKKKYVSVLEHLGTVKVPATTKKFVVAKHFTSRNKAGVIFSGFGDNFKKNFLSKVEEAQAETTLSIDRLKKDCSDALILSGIGSVAETTLAVI